MRVSCLCLIVLLSLSGIVACAANPVDAGLSKVESSLIALEHDVHEFVGQAVLPASAREKLEGKAAELRTAYIVLVRTDEAVMTKDQQARWVALRKRSIDVIADMANLLAKSQPN